MKQNEWVQFLKENKNKGKDISTLSAEYRKLYNKTILYPYIQRNSTKECRKISKTECQSNKNCYWKGEFCSKIPDRSHQINPLLKKNQNQNINIQRQKESQSHNIPLNTKVTKLNPRCDDYKDPVNCISNEKCNWNNNRCSYKDIFEDIFGENMPEEDDLFNKKVNLTFKKKN
jgi:hypothetical protein